MTITKNLTHKLFITTLILTITNSHQLHAMDSTSLYELRRTGPETVKTNDEITLNADFQAYKLFSSLNNDHEWYLPAELVRIIATNASKLIDKECYEKHNGKKHLDDPYYLLKFIENKQDIMTHISIATIIKRMLRHSGKSVDEIKDSAERTAFHRVSDYEKSIMNNIDLIKILYLIVESEAWNIIWIKEFRGNTVLHSTLINLSESPIKFWVTFVKELLSAAPSSQEAWNLIITPNNRGTTPLKLAMSHSNTDIVQLLESYRP